MRIALILRGISYYEDKYTIDFRNTAPSIQHHLIRDLELAGHKVDIFLLTHPSKYIQALIEGYKPVSWKLKEYKNIPFGEAQIIVGEPMMIDQHLDCIDLCEAYEKEHAFEYDHVLITRFDLFYYQSISKVAIDYDAFNYSFKHEDGFLFYPRSKNEVLRDCLTQMKRDNKSVQQAGQYLMGQNEPVNYIFGEKKEGIYDYPFYKLGELVFGNNKKYDYEQLLSIPMNHCPTRPRMSDR